MPAVSCQNTQNAFKSLKVFLLEAQLHHTQFTFKPSEEWKSPSQRTKTSPFFSFSCYRQVLQISFSPIISHFCGVILGQFLVRQKFQNNCECRLILKENSEQRPFNLKARNSLENIPKGCPRHIYTFLDILPWLHWGCCLGGRLGWPNSREKFLSTVCKFVHKCGIWRYFARLQVVIKWRTTKIILTVWFQKSPVWPKTLKNIEQNTAMFFKLDMFCFLLFSKIKRLLLWFLP